MEDESPVFSYRLCSTLCWLSTIGHVRMCWDTGPGVTDDHMDAETAFDWRRRSWGVHICHNVFASSNIEWKSKMYQVPVQWSQYIYVYTTWEASGKNLFPSQLGVPLSAHPTAAFQEYTLEMIEFFAGRGNLSRCMKLAGIPTASLDILYSGSRRERSHKSNAMDINSPSGFWFLCWIRTWTFFFGGVVESLYIQANVNIYINILVGPRYHQSSFQRAGISGSYLDTTPKLVWHTDVNIGFPYQTFW